MPQYLTTEEQRWALALENASFGLWDLDPRVETVHYSPQWKARLGFPRLHAPDTTAFWRCRVHPDDFDSMFDSLRSHLDGHGSSYEMRFRLRSNGSGYRTVVSRGRVVERDAQGQATRMVGTMVDLTGRPARMARAGLAAEESWVGSAAMDPPLHTTLRGGGPAGSRLLVDRIGDLLELALRESSPAL
ncbi:MAG: PAS domain-containing protein [Piscinibacter sp.]